MSTERDAAMNLVEHWVVAPRHGKPQVVTDRRVAENTYGAIHEWTVTGPYVLAESFDALRAERDRLAEALRDIEAWVGPGFVKNRARAALSGEQERSATRHGRAHVDDGTECTEPAWCHRGHVATPKRPEEER